MYRAYFKVNKQEPERMYFRAEEKTPHTVEFKAQEKEPIRFLIKDTNFEIA